MDGNGEYEPGSLEWRIAKGLFEAAAPLPDITEFRVRDPLDWAALESQQPPLREWAIRHWLGMGYVTLLAGPPGSGKTAVAQAIASAIALGRPVIDDVPQARISLMWAGEDDRAELWRRQLAIAQWLGEPLSAFAGKAIVEPYADKDLTLAVEIDGTLCQTPLMKELREQIGDYKAEVVYLDSIARIYGGKENDRHQVTQFISWLTWALQPTSAALSILGHPARSQGSEFSGSSAWEASCRARLYFGHKLPDAEQDDEEPDTNVRWLAKRKSNYSSQDTRRVKWINGCMQPDAAPEMEYHGKGKFFLIDETIRIFRKLKSMGLDPGATKGVNYLPSMARDQKLLTGTLTHRDLVSGLAACMSEGRLKVGVVGQYANRTPRKGLVE